MMARLLQILLTCTFLPGLCVLTPSTFRVYHHVLEGKSWREAQSYCRTHYKDLVSIESMEEYDEIRTGMKGDNSYWTGLYKDAKKLHVWYWSLVVPGAYQPHQTGYKIWGEGKELFNFGKQCVFQSVSGGSWINANCQDKRHFICYDDKEEGAARYILVRSSFMWKDARDYCRTNHTDLASARNPTESAAIENAGGGGGWIGLFRDSWTWSDGSRSSFRMWSPKIDVENPNRAGYDKAIIYSTDGKLANYRDGSKFSFICYSESHDVPRVSTESPIIPTSATDSLASPFVSTVPPSVPKWSRQVLKLTVTQGDATVNLNDPAVTAAILKQVKDKLKQSGVNGDLKLTWKKQPDGKIFHKEKTEL